MLSIQHMSGVKMTADIGTEPLASERLRQLKQEMHTVDVPHMETQEMYMVDVPHVEDPEEHQKN